MNWKILNVSIPVNDFKKSIAFYEMLLGKLKFSNEVFMDIFENKDDCFLGIIKILVYAGNIISMFI